MSVLLDPARPSLALALALALGLSQGCKRDPLGDPVLAFESADPRIGTGGGGFAQGQAFPGAALPFGMIRPGPDTNGPLLGRAGWAHCAGYWAFDDFIDGFSQTHVHGTGVEDQGLILVMATDGMSAAKRRENGYGSFFDAESEHAEPGYYTVTLTPSGIRAELTATERVAFHRYTFPATVAEPTLVIDAGHGIGRDGSLGGELSVDPATGRITGRILSTGRFTGTGGAYDLHFALELDPPPAGLGVFDDADLQPGTTVSGIRIGAHAAYPTGTTEVRVKATVSVVDAAGAAANLDSGARQDFDTVRFGAKERWSDRLRTIEIWGGSEADQRTFYSALYRSLIMPTRYDDGDGRSLGVDRVVRDFAPFYSDLSLWDTYRTAHPLYALLWPEDAAAFGESLLEMNDRLGYLPRWPLAMNEHGTMIGAPASIVLAESVLKDLPLDAHRVWTVLEAEADLGSPRPNHTTHARCAEVGFCPADEIGGGVSKAVEYGWADFAVARLAEERGDASLAAALDARSLIYTAHYDPASGFLRGKNLDGSLTEADFDPTPWNDAFVEGNAWQYLFSAPYDPVALVEMIGDRAALLERLDELFVLSEGTEPIVLGTEPFFEPDPYYWHGNEPDLHYPWLYALMGEPGRGARWIDWVRRRHYDDTPDGLAGNDDAGTLSAWYVFSALGLYPLAGSDLYLIGTPLFERALVHLPGGDLTIVSEPFEKKGERGVAVHSVTWNDEPLTDPWLTHAQLAAGGELRFLTSPLPPSPDAEPPEWGAGRPWSPRPDR
ncbi:MAG: GH92 family glycosyl hydrolase [Deltaproteobacteria bacterium]|nr:GH92 family glycosyl hydrolase [Deltaproteobacteria bacterium]